MKEFIALYKTITHDFCEINNADQLSDLHFLLLFFSGDYTLYDTRLFNRVVNFYNITFIYNDVINKNLYIGKSLWEMNEDIDAPAKNEFSEYVNESNSCKINYHNFIEFAQSWTAIKSSENLLALIYRDDNDWIDCKGFESQEEMEMFVKNN